MDMEQEPYKYIYYDGRVYNQSYASNRNWIERAEDFRNGRWEVSERQDCMIYHNDDKRIIGIGHTTIDGVLVKFGELTFLTESELKELKENNPELFI